MSIKMKKTAGKVEIELLFPEIHEIHKEKLIVGIKEVTKKAWGDPAQLAEKWINLADVLVLARERGTLIGFATGKFLDSQTVNLIATVIDPDFQGKGLSTKLNSIIIRNFYLRNPIRLITGFRMVFRTQNPSLYEKVYGKLILFPDYRGMRKVDSEDKRILEIIKENFCPTNQVDEESFVIKGAHEKYPELIYQVEKIPWAKDPKINEFFETKLGLGKRTGNTMVLVGKVNFWHILKYDLLKG
jgi:hypothetical protein